MPLLDALGGYIRFELDRTFVGKRLENAQAQRDGDGPVLVGPDLAAVRTPGLGLQVLRRDDELPEAQVAQRDLDQALLVDVELDLTSGPLGPLTMVRSRT